MNTKGLWEEEDHGSEEGRHKGLEERHKGLVESHKGSGEGPEELEEQTRSLQAARTVAATRRRGWEGHAMQSIACVGKGK